MAQSSQHNPAAISRIHFCMNLCKKGRLNHARTQLKNLHALERREVIHPGKHSLAVLTMIRGEEAYLPDWLDFHRQQGVSHFYIYDNAVDDAEADKTFHFLQRYILEEKWVSYIRWPDVPGCRVGCIRNRDRSTNSIQELAFRDFKKRFGPQTQYYIKMDIDEYMFHRDGGHIPDVFPFRGTIALRGYNFGSSGLLTSSSEAVWKRFVWREESAKHVKSISRTNDVYEFFNAHLAFDKPWIYFTLRSSQHARVRERVRSALGLHHYKLKSREEFIQQRVKTDGYLKGEYTLEDFSKLDGPMNAVREDILARRFP
jgi:hypothetical protein